MPQIKKALARRLKERFRLDNQVARDAWVVEQLRMLPDGARILDAGCGRQPYRSACQHLEYTSQDFGQYTTDEKKRLGYVAGAVTDPYPYGSIDVVSDVWSIPLPDESFDAILCTEVLEHVPYPIATVRELSRVLRAGGTMILTVPNSSLRHQDPYFFTSGLTDRWFERILPEVGLQIETLDELGDYYSWIKVQLFNTAAVRGMAAAALLAPAFVYFALQRPDSESIATLTEGYLVVSRKLVTNPHAH